MKSRFQQHLGAKGGWFRLRQEQKARQSMAKKGSEAPGQLDASLGLQSARRGDSRQ